MKKITCTYIDKFGNCELTGNDCLIDFEDKTEFQITDECDDFELHFEDDDSAFDMNRNEYFL